MGFFDLLLRFLPMAVSFVLGGLVERGRAWLKRRTELKEIGAGHRFHTLEYRQLFVTEKGGVKRLHSVALGSLPIEMFFPNRAAAEHLINASVGTAGHESVVPMPGALGSFILHELFGLTRMVGPKAIYPLDWWVMVPVFETFSPTEFQTPTVVFVRLGDLHHFESFASCRDMHVFVGSDGASILTAMEIARKFTEQTKKFREARAAGRATRHLEEMWTVQMRFDVEVLEPPAELVTEGMVRGFRPVPWDRFGADLAALGLTSS